MDDNEGIAAAGDEESSSACRRPKIVRPKRSKGSASPTQLTLKHFRKLGFPLVQVVEHWNPHARVRVDLFGVGDVLAIGDEIVLAQTTSWDNVSARVKKITESEALAPLRKAGVRLLVHGWRKNYQGRWEMREVDLS